jgi:hypothetical protein
MVLDLVALVSGEDLRGGGALTLVVERNRAAREGRLGLTVQEALELRRFDVDEIETVEEGLVTGVVRGGEGRIDIVDPSRIGAPTGTGGEGFRSTQGANGGE